MKKFLALLLACMMLVGAVGCSTLDTTNNGSTSATPTPTQAPTNPTDPPQTPEKLALAKIDTPYTNAEERAAWMAEMGLSADAMPTQAVTFELVDSYTAPGLPLEQMYLAKTMVITNKDELDAWYATVNDPTETCQRSYERLAQIDFSKQAALFFHGEYGHVINASLEGLYRAENGLLIVYTTDFDGFDAAQANEFWGYLAIVNKSDLPESGDFEIAYCIQYPNVTDPARQEIYRSYPSISASPDRYVFQTVTE